METKYFNNGFVGKAVFNANEAIKCFNAGMEIRLPLLMQVFFLVNRSREENILYFKRLADACRNYMASFSDIENSIGFYESEYDLKDQSMYWKMTVDFGRRSLQMYIDWAKHCIEELEKEE